MENREFPTEKAPSPDFLDENLKIKIRLEKEAEWNMPRISSEDLETKQEKYAVLLGKTEIVSQEEVGITIKGVLEMVGDEQAAFYSPGIEGVSNINIPGLRKYVERLQQRIPEYADFSFIGDVHTHPVLPRDLGGLSSCDPSGGDIEGIIKYYETGKLNKNSPFIFGIIGPNDEGILQYAFYRIVKSGDKYDCLQIKM